MGWPWPRNLKTVQQKPAVPIRPLSCVLTAPANQTLSSVSSLHRSFLRTRLIKRRRNILLAALIWLAVPMGSARQPVQPRNKRHSQSVTWVDKCFVKRETFVQIPTISVPKMYIVHKFVTLHTAQCLSYVVTDPVYVYLIEANVKVRLVVQQKVNLFQMRVISTLGSTHQLWLHATMEDVWSEELAWPLLVALKISPKHPDLEHSA